VGHLDVEVVAGPFPMRSEPGDHPRYPGMTRSIVETPRGEIAWSNLRGAYVLPGGGESASLAGALCTVLGL
jgi:hypothetical protein